MKNVKDYYPITTRSLPDGDVYSFVTPTDLEKFTKPEELESLNNYLMGSTMYLEGHFLHDIERWLNNMRNIDF